MKQGVKSAIRLYISKLPDSMTFSLDGVQMVNLSEWLTLHNPTCVYATRQGASGGRLCYAFTPTSLGLVTQVTCACGQGIDLTDYDW